MIQTLLLLLKHGSLKILLTQSLHQTNLHVLERTENYISVHLAHIPMKTGVAHMPMMTGVAHIPMKIGVAY